MKLRNKIEISFLFLVYIGLVIVFPVQMFYFSLFCGIVVSISDLVLIRSNWEK